MKREFKQFLAARAISYPRDLLVLLAFLKEELLALTRGGGRPV